MKILVVGDFHGKFPMKLQRLAKGVDLVVSLGDYSSFSYRKLWFKHCYGKDIELWEVIGKKKLRELILKDLKTGEKILWRLNNLGVPVISVVGNLDYANVNDQYSISRWTHRKWKWYEQDFFSKVIRKYKNIQRFDYSYKKFGEIVFIGGFGHTSPGQVKSKAYRKYRAKLDKLFKKFAKENNKRKVIFITHNMPYNSRLDKIISKKTYEKVQGKHYGSKLIRRIINRYQPILHIGGHIHENLGRCKIGKTLVINPGAALDGRCVIIDFDVEKGKVKKVKFVK